MGETLLLTTQLFLVAGFVSLGVFSLRGGGKSGLIECVTDLLIAFLFAYLVVSKLT